MALKEFLKRKGGVYTFYGITNAYEQNPYFQIQGVENKEEFVKELCDAVFKKAPKGLFVFVSDKAWYIGRTELKKASIVTLALDKTKGKKEFDEEIKASKRWRSKNLNYVEKTIKPFLKRTFSKTNLVLGAVLRGDLVDSSRFPSSYSDINIILITGFKSNDKTSKTALLKLLKKSPGQTSYTYYNFEPHHYHDEGEKNLNPNDAEFSIEYSIISLPGSRELASQWRKSNKKIPKYDAINLSKAKIIFDKNGSAKKFLKLIKLFSLM